MNFTTPSLATQYDELVLLRQIKAIKASEFKSRVKILVDKQKKNDERNRIAREKREAIREAERQREIARKLKEAEDKAKASRLKAKAKALVKKQNAIVRSNVVMDKLVPDDVEKFVYRELWKGLSERYPSLLVYIIPEDKKDDESRLDIEYYKKYAEYRKQFGYDSLNLNSGDRFIALTDTKISGERLQQAFRDGIQHCVFEPIVSKIKNAIESSKSKDASKKWVLRLKRINELEKQYKDGVPEDKMGDVATASGYKIMIKDILGNDINVYNDKSKKGQIIFTNTRANHIDTGFVSLDEKGVELSQDEMNEKWDDIRNSGEFYMIQGDLKNKLPKKILTIDGVWALQNDEKKYFDEMNAIVDIRGIQFNATAHPDVNEFIKAGRVINSWNCKLNDDVATGHIDMPKAYTQFKKCSMYRGFMGHIHQWRTGSFDADFMENNIGMYRFKVLSGGNEYFKRVGMVVGSEHILPSPEILFYIKNGLEVSIDAGVTVFS